MSFYKNIDSPIVQVLPRDFYVDSFEHAIEGKNPYVLDHKDKIFKLTSGEVFDVEFRGRNLYLKTVIDYPLLSNCNKCIFGNYRRKNCQLLRSKQEIENQFADEYHKYDFFRPACEVLPCHFEEAQL